MQRFQQTNRGFEQLPEKCLDIYSLLLPHIFWMRPICITYKAEGCVGVKPTSATFILNREFMRAVGTRRIPPIESRTLRQDVPLVIHQSILTHINVNGHLNGRRISFRLSQVKHSGQANRSFIATMTKYVIEGP